jgi:LAO/AO transport system kinase
MLAPAFHRQETPVAVIKTIASQKEGIEELYSAINDNLKQSGKNTKHFWLLAEKAYYLIQQKRLKDIDKATLQESIKKEGADFNLYRFIKNYD